MRQSRRIGFARERSIPTDDAVRRKISRQIEPRQNPMRRRERFVGEHGERRAARELIEQLRNARVRSGVAQEPAVVDRQKAIEGVGRPLDAGGGKRASDERRRAVADHPSDCLFAQRLRAACHQRGIRRLGDVLAGIDEGAVEVEDDQTEPDIAGCQDCRIAGRKEKTTSFDLLPPFVRVYSANDVGVSQTLTRTTGRPWCWRTRR